MKIDDMTIGEAKELAAMFGGTKHQSHSLEIGATYLIRTVTMMYTGRIIAVTDSDLVLEKAAWIADSGRYADALETGSLSEVEPYPDQVIVSRAAIVDAAYWSHKLPRDQK